MRTDRHRPRVGVSRPSWRRAAGRTRRHALWLTLLTVGCGRVGYDLDDGGAPSIRDAGAGRADAGTVRDAGVVDAASAGDAGGPAAVDAGADAGIAPMDAGGDAGVVPRDAGGPVDAGLPSGSFAAPAIVSGAAGQITAATFGSAGELYVVGFGSGASIDTGRDTAVAPSGTSYGFAARYESTGSTTWGHFLSLPNQTEPAGVGHIGTYALIFTYATGSLSFGGFSATGSEFSALVGYTDVPGAEEVYALPPFSNVRAVGMATGATGDFTIIGHDVTTTEGFYGTVGTAGPPATRVPFGTLGKFLSVARGGSPTEFSVISGNYEGSVTFPGLMLSGSATVSTGFLAGVGADGRGMFGFEVAASGDVQITHVAFTPDGGLAFAGHFSGVTTSFGSSVASVSGGPDAFVAYAALDGTAPALSVRVVRSWFIQATGSDSVGGLAVLGNDIYALGVTEGASTIGGVDVGTTMLSDIFLARFDRTSGAVTATVMRSAGNDQAHLLSGAGATRRLAMGYRTERSVTVPWSGTRTTAGAAGLVVFPAP